MLKDDNQNYEAGAGEDELLELILREKMISRVQYEEIKAEAQKKHKTTEKIIEESKIIREEDFSRLKSKVYNLPYMDLFGRIVRAEILNIVPAELAKNYRMAAFNKTGDEVSVAMVEPSNFRALEAVEY
jgi:hypothetical protein